jgi:hypothetical protein
MNKRLIVIREIQYDWKKLSSKKKFTEAVKKKHPSGLLLSGIKINLKKCFKILLRKNREKDL